MIPQRSDITQWPWYPTKMRGKAQSQQFSNHLGACGMVGEGYPCPWVQTSLSCPGQPTEAGGWIWLWSLWANTASHDTHIKSLTWKGAGLSLGGGLHNKTHFRYKLLCYPKDSWKCYQAAPLLSKTDRSHPLISALPLLLSTPAPKPKHSWRLPCWPRCCSGVTKASSACQQSRPWPSLSAWYAWGLCMWLRDTEKVKN